jgi:hypothetical protein
MAQKAFFVFVSIVTLAFTFALWSATAATTSAVVSESITPPTQMLYTDKTEATVTGETTLDYTLPYPGILPDHPLYKIKTFRDKVLDFLIRDPLKRIEFNLLMADKRLNMSMMLVDREKFQLSEETVSKGEKYFTKAVDEYKKAKDEGRLISGELTEKMKKSSEKHVIILLELKDKSPESIKNGFESSYSLSQENHDRLLSITQ